MGWNPHDECPDKGNAYANRTGPQTDGLSFHIRHFHTLLLARYDTGGDITDLRSPQPVDSSDPAEVVLHAGGPYHC